MAETRYMVNLKSDGFVYHFAGFGHNRKPLFYTQYLCVSKRVFTRYYKSLKYAKRIAERCRAYHYIAPDVEIYVEECKSEE